MKDVKSLIAPDVLMEEIMMWKFVKIVEGVFALTADYRNVQKIGTELAGSVPAKLVLICPSGACLNSICIIALFGMCQKE